MKSNKLIRFTLFVLFISSAIFADDYADKLDKLMAEFDNAGIFSGNVILSKDGSKVFEKSYGYADWESKTPVTETTLFNIGSLNKMFTHSAILQLQKEGKLSVNDPLNKYLKLFPDDIGGKITIQMLIEMKAGLNDYLRDPAFRQNIEKFKTVSDFLEIIKDELLLFEPGTGQEYSNSGYVVLGGIIEKVTGKSYTDNLKERFFVPLGIKDAYYRQIGDNVPNCAAGTELNYKGGKKVQQFHGMPSPAGGLFMNANDLLKFDNFLKTAGLISPGIRAGGTPGWNSVFAQYKNGYTLIITSNISHAAEEVEMRFRDAMNDKPYPPPQVETFEMKLYNYLTSGGVNGLEKNLEQAVKDDGAEYSDMVLNFFGYQLMNGGDLNLAIDVFKLNVKLFPDVPNVYDSLGEAYMKAGNKELAIANYKKVLEMNPQNQNAKKMLEELNN